MHLSPSVLRASCMHLRTYSTAGRLTRSVCCRAGRTARGASQGGLVSILVLGRQLKLARQIVRRNARELPIHSLPSLPD